MKISCCLQTCECVCRAAGWWSWPTVTNHRVGGFVEANSHKVWFYELVKSQNNFASSQDYGAHVWGNSSLYQSILYQCFTVSKEWEQGVQVQKQKINIWQTILILWQSTKLMSRKLALSLSYKNTFILKFSNATRKS